jgi:hypothetical protein
MVIPCVIMLLVAIK